MKHFLKIVGYSIGFMVLIQVCTPYSSFATTCENRSNNPQVIHSSTGEIIIEKETQQFIAPSIANSTNSNAVEINNQHSKKLKIRNKKRWYNDNIYTRKMTKLIITSLVELTGCFL